MTNFVLVFDATAAFIFVILMTFAGRAEVVTCPGKTRNMLFIRRLVYAVVSICLVWRVWDLVTSERIISTIGSLINIVLVSALLVLSIVRINWRLP